MENATVTARWLCSLSVTTNSAVPPSATGSASAIDSVGRSSSVMVPVAVSSASVAPSELLKVTENVSSASGRLSSMVTTEMVLVVSPAVKVSVPELWS